MKPSQVASKLRQIAAAIDNSRNPRADLVARDLKRIVAAVEPGYDFPEEEYTQTMFEVEDHGALFSDWIGEWYNSGDYTVVSVERTGADEAVVMISSVNLPQPFGFEFSGEETVAEAHKAFTDLPLDPAHDDFQNVVSALGNMGWTIGIEDRDKL
jgi:hypothetical protein